MASEAFREQMISELKELRYHEALAEWARRVLPAKTRLLPKDAELVEGAFSARLGEFDEMTGFGAKQEPSDEFATKAASYSVVPIFKPVRERDRHHRQFVAKQPYLVCERTPTDAHHVKIAQPMSLGRKVGDKFTVPLCRLHHRSLHHLGNKRAWSQTQGIDPLPVAEGLWKKTREEIRKNQIEPHAPFDGTR